MLEVSLQLECAPIVYCGQLSLQWPARYFATSAKGVTEPRVRLAF
jgi:hypothetical protein